MTALRRTKRALVSCCLALAATVVSACGAASGASVASASDPGISTSGDQAATDASNNAADTSTATPLQTITDDPVRASSVSVAGQWIGYDDDESRVEVVGPPGRVEIASRAQLGCIAWDADAERLLVATFERDPDLPISHLVLSAVDSDGEVNPLASPEFWPEPGARCAWVPGEDGERWSVVTRARKAEDTAPMDLWFVGLDGSTSALRSGVRVPLVHDAVTVADGALLALQEVADDPETGRVLVYRLVHASADGTLTPLASGAPPEQPLALAAEQRTVAVAWVEGHVPRGDADRAQRPYADVVARVMPRDDVRHGQDAPLRRTSVVDPVQRDHPPQLVFADGAWWALLAPEPYTLRGKSEPAEYRERAVRIDEGNAFARALPSTLRARGADHGALVLTGPPVETQPGFAAGIEWTPRWTRSLTTASSVGDDDE